MVQYSYLYIAQATMRTGKTLNCAMIDVKEFGSKIQSGNEKRRKNCYEIALSQSQRSCSQGENLCVYFRRTERLKIRMFYLYFFVWSYALLPLMDKGCCISLFKFLVHGNVSHLSRECLSSR